MRISSMTGVFEASDSSKPSSTSLDDRLEIGARIDKPDLDFHGEGVASLLHDRGAFAIVLADDDHGAALDPARGQIGERIGGDIGADGALPGDGAADRIVDARGKRRSGGCLAGARLEVDAELAEDISASASTSIRCEIGAP